MRQTPAALAAALAIAAGWLLAGPALAADLVYPKSATTELTRSNAGSPYWLLQSQCAGMFSAAFTHHANKGRSEIAEADKEIGKAMLNAAIDRLIRDRGLERKPAFDLAMTQFNVGRLRAFDLIHDRGTGRNSLWSVQRSVCMDINDAYTGQQG
jgi:hypothetical protein